MAEDQIRTSRAMIESPSTRTIQAGGPSSSEELNTLRSAILGDLAELDRRTEETAEELELAQLLAIDQNASLSALLSSLRSQLPASADRWFADFWRDSYVDGSSTAEVSTLYGQVTLPILRQQDNLVGRDSRDQIWIPKDTRISYAYKATEPNEQDWKFDDRAVYALDGRDDTAWWREREGSDYVWVRVQVTPSLHANKLSNCILLHPWPALALDLHAVEYRTPNGAWAAADLSYLTGWNEAGSQVEQAGNCRIWIPPTQVTEFRLKLDAHVAERAKWGFSLLGLQWVEFQPAATLVTDFSDHNPPTLDTVTLYGKDQDALGYLTTNINGPLITVAFTQLSQGTTPVLTGVEVLAA